MSTHAHPLPHRSRWPGARLLWVFIGLIVAAGIGVALDQTLSSSGTEALSSAPKDVRASVQALVSGSIPRAILYVRKGDRSYSVAVGYADTAEKVPMQAGDIFPIGTTTKTYTAVLVMRLVAQAEPVKPGETPRV
jgi:CubicO group peptidase (beta-lactamase class C family)